MTEKCPDCGGTGRKIVKATSSGGTIKIRCPTCKGTGKKPKKKAAKSRSFFIDLVEQLCCPTG